MLTRPFVLPLVAADFAEGRACTVAHADASWGSGLQGKESRGTGGSDSNIIVGFRVGVYRLVDYMTRIMENRKQKTKTKPGFTWGFYGCP